MNVPPNDSLGDAHRLDDASSDEFLLQQPDIAEVEMEPEDQPHQFGIFVNDGEVLPSGL